mmetsp:Transcript_4420/g.7512  ORF Transcript_4420/g.7512 Transcript_4420/m.7512 type:complete len:273 (-) Transcript_4420:1885-2703(-)
MFVFGSKDELYFFLTRFSKRYGLRYLQKHYDFMDKYLPLGHIERHGLEIRQLSTISQHESGVNQIVKLNNKQVVTISDDCSMKQWKTASTGTVGEKVSDNDMRVEHQTTTETTTCMCVTGRAMELIVTGCHSGNLNFHRSAEIKDSKCLYHAHSNLIRVLISLSGVNNEYFLSADVCGTVKVWPTDIYQRLDKKRKDQNQLSQQYYNNQYQSMQQIHNNHNNELIGYLPPPRSSPALQSQMLEDLALNGNSPQAQPGPHGSPGGNPAMQQSI